MIYKNGELIDESPKLNDNFLYEVIRYEDGVYLFLEKHLKRLKNNLEKSNKLDMFKSVEKYLNEFKPEKDVQSVMIMIDDSDVYVKDMEIREVTDLEREEGVFVKFYEFTRLDPTRKIYRKKFKQEIENRMKQEDVFEFLLTQDGEIEEGSRSNFYYIVDGKIYEPPSEKVLPGIVKSNFHNMLKEKYNIDLIEKNINKSDIINIGGAILSGTGMDVVPIKQINDKIFEGEDYKLSIKFSKDYREFINDYKDKYLRGILWITILKLYHQEKNKAL